MKTSALLAMMLGLGLPAYAAASEEPNPVLTSAPIKQDFSAPGAQLTAGSDASKVTLKFALPNRSDIPSDGTSPLVPGGAKYTSWDISAEVPLKKGQTSQNLLSLDGFGTAASVGLNIYRLVTDWRNLTPAELKERADKCGGFTDAGKCKNPDAIPLSLRPGPQPGGWLYGASAKFGSQESTVYDPMTLAKSEVKNQPWSFGGFVGWMPKAASNTLLTLKVERRRTYKDGDTSIRCPAAGGGVVQCVEGAFAAPTIKIGTALTLEARALLRPNVGVALAIARDFGQKSTAIELPVYWLGDGSGGLTGGVKFNWASGENKTAASIFVGAPFALFQ